MIPADVTFEFATQDDCLDKMIPSDLRQLVAERDELQAKYNDLKTSYDIMCKIRIAGQPEVTDETQ